MSPTAVVGLGHATWRPVADVDAHVALLAGRFDAVVITSVVDLERLSGVMARPLRIRPV